MPEAYTAMRDAFIRQGLAAKAAKTKAAKIYNSKNPKTPVSGHAPGETDNRANTDNRGLGD